MPTLEIGRIVEATSGRLVRGDSAATVSSFDIDTRLLSAGSGFFALPGTRTDGHEFLPQAARAGATLAVVERDLPADVEGPAAIVRVDDVVEALARTAVLARERLREATVVAVAGSTGKTTTKELIAAGLAAIGSTHRTAGNRNNHLGVPLTLLACPEDARFVVVEIGMSAAGEVAALARLARPDVGIVTNVAPEHMEYFESIDDVAAAEGELYAVLAEDATSVVNVDDVHTRVQGLRHDGPQITFGTSERANVRMHGFEARFRPGTRLTVAVLGKTRSVQLRLGGAHAAWNALASLAAIHAAGADVEVAAEAIAAVEPSPGRGRVHELPDGIVLVDDSYNSSPAAVASVLAVVASERDVDRRVLVLGDMLEMGADAALYHQEAGRRAASAGVALLIGVGPLSKNALETARRAGVGEVYHVRDAHAAADMLLDLLRPRDLVVIKGSRGIGLERTVQAILGARRAEEV